MFKRVISAVLLLGVMLQPYAGGVQAEEHFKPFVLASRGGGGFDTRVEETRSALSGAGFEIVGEYTPYAGTFVDDTRVIIVTNDELRAAAEKSERGGFAAPWRVAVTKVADEVQVSYVNPKYIAHAYRLDSDLNAVAERLERALGAGRGADERHQRCRHHQRAGRLRHRDRPHSSTTLRGVDRRTISPRAFHRMPT